MDPLNSDNYMQGFLVDDDLMAGVTPHPEKPDTYVAFVLQHATGEYLGYQPFPDLPSALKIINDIPRTWTYERLGGCGSGKCGKAGSCDPANCSAGKCNTGACNVET